MVMHKTIGIIGGQGPASTIDIYNRIITYYQDKFGARYISDYPPMVIFSIPTPTLVKSIANEEKTFSTLFNAIKGLEREGSDFIIITCLSLQYFINKLQDQTKIPIISMSPILAKYIKHKNYKTVGVLGTYTTIKKRICDKSLKELGIIRCSK